nr:MAG TPA: hypothetical protein [Herelleviridae sp.]
MQRVRFNLKFIHNVSNENFFITICEEHFFQECSLALF